MSNRAVGTMYSPQGDYCLQCNMKALHSNAELCVRSTYEFQRYNTIQSTFYHAQSFHHEDPLTSFGSQSHLHHIDQALGDMIGSHLL